MDFINAKVEPQAFTTNRNDEAFMLAMLNKNHKLADRLDGSKAIGGVGETCLNCLGINMSRNGSCLVCLDCGETTGCS